MDIEASTWAPSSTESFPVTISPCIIDSDISERTSLTSIFPEIEPEISALEQLILPLILPDFPTENIIIEPDRRDTAPAMGFNAVHLGLRDMDEPIAFIPSDHYIARVGEFLNCLEQAEKVINDTGKLLDIAILPTEPNTALGYTKIGERWRRERGQARGAQPPECSVAKREVGPLVSNDTSEIKFYEFEGHKEKPDFETAKKYVESGEYLWHANYYMWSPKKFMEAYEKYAPEMFKILKKIEIELKNSNNQDKINKLYSSMERVSIDYAITEKINPKDVLIIKGEFGWKDIGTWDTLHENLLIQADEKRNLVKGERLNIDTSGSIIYGKKDKIIATIGVDDMIIIDTEDALLVCPKSRAQDVKQVIEELKARGDRRV